MATSIVKIASMECPIALIDSYLKRRLDVNVNVTSTIAAHKFDLRVSIFRSILSSPLIHPGLLYFDQEQLFRAFHAEMSLVNNK